MWRLWWSLLFPPALLLRLDFIESVVHLAAEFDANCVSYLWYKVNGSTDLIKKLYQSFAIYSIHVADEVEFEVTHQGNFSEIPFPCSYIFHLPDSNLENLYALVSYRAFRGDYWSLTPKYILITDTLSSLTQIDQMLSKIVSLGFLGVILVNPEPIVKAYTLAPFGWSLDSCPKDNKVEVIGTWSNGSFVSRKSPFPVEAPTVFSNCEFTANYVELEPIVFQKGDKMLGTECEWVYLIAEQMNFTLKWLNRKVFVDTIINNTVVPGVMSDLYKGITDILVIGREAPQSPFTTTHRTFSASYVIAVPAPDLISKLKIIYIAFQKTLWISVIAALFCSPFIFSWIARSSREKMTVGNALSITWAIAFSNSAYFNTKKLAVCIFLGSWFFYTMHINLAYTATLTGLITTFPTEPLLDTLDKVLDSGLTTRMFDISVFSLKEIDDKKVKLLLDHIQLVEYGDLDNAFRSVSTFKNQTLVESETIIRYYLGTVLEPGLQVVTTDIIIQSYSFGLLMYIHHYLLNPMNKQILHIHEHGLSNEIYKRYLPAVKKPVIDSELRPYSLKDLSGPFLVLAIGLIASTLVFIGEKIHYRKTSN